MGRFKVALYDQHSTPTKNFPSKGKSITFKGAVGPVNNLSSQGLFNPNLDFYSIECLYQQGMQQGQNSTRKLRIQKVFCWATANRLCIFEHEVAQSEGKMELLASLCNIP